MKIKQFIFFVIFLLFIPILAFAQFGTFGPWIGLREQASTPSSSTNGGKLFIDTNNDLYYLNELGNTTQLNASGSLSDPSTIGTLTIGSNYVGDPNGINFGASDTKVSLILHNAATITMNDADNDTTVVIGPVTDGTNTLGINGAIDLNGSLTATSIYVDGYIYRDVNDNNTAAYFRDDRFTLYTGGRTMIDAFETTQDYLYLGYDGSNDIDVSIGPNACLFVEGSSGKVTMTTEIELPHANGDVTPNETGEIFYDESDDQWVFYDANSGELIANEVAISAIQHISVSVDPGTWYNSDSEIFIMTIGDDAPSGIIIDEWKCSCNVDPDTEINADLRYADDWITLANAVDIDEIDTTNGTSSEDTDSNINSGSAVVNGKVIYIGFDADPEGTCTQMIFEIWYHAID